MFTSGSCYIFDHLKPVNVDTFKGNRRVDSSRAILVDLLFFYNRNINNKGE